MKIKCLKFNLQLAAWLLIFSAGAAAQTPPAIERDACFAFDALAPAQRQRAEELLVKALDSEALYTIVGAVKPMSSGFQQFRVAVQLPRVAVVDADRAISELGAKKPEELTDEEKSRLSRARSATERRDALARLEETRQILEKWRCGGELFADVQHFARTYDGKRSVDTMVFSRPRLQQMLGEKADFFSRWAITESAHPLEVLAAVEHDETSARNGGYGFLFGYPDYAVRFFVEAVNEEDLTGKFVERDFRSIPTFGRETNSFVYAVPKNSAENETDRNLKQRAERILASYKRRRAEYVGAGKKGAAQMLRDWFCGGDGKCSPSRAKID